MGTESGFKRDLGGHCKESRLRIGEATQHEELVANIPAISVLIDQKSVMLLNGTD